MDVAARLWSLRPVLAGCSEQALLVQPTRRARVVLGVVQRGRGTGGDGVEHKQIAPPVWFCVGPQPVRSVLALAWVLKTPNGFTSVGSRPAGNRFRPACVFATLNGLTSSVVIAITGWLLTKVIAIAGSLAWAVAASSTLLPG